MPPLYIHYSSLILLNHFSIMNYKNKLNNKKETFINVSFFYLILLSN